jgi:hypothetical protein
MRLVDAADEDAPPVIAFELPTAPAEPLEVRQFSARLPPITIPRPGAYRWQLLHAGAVLAEQPFKVVLAEGPPVR